MVARGTVCLSHIVLGTVTVYTYGKVCNAQSRSATTYFIWAVDRLGGR